MHAICCNRVEYRTGRLSFAMDPNDTVAGLFQRPIYHRILKIMEPITNGPIYLIYRAVLKLKAEVAICFGVTGQDQHTRRVLIEPVTYLRIRVIFARQVQQVERVGTILKGGQARWLVDDHIIVILPEKDIAESDSAFQCRAYGLPDALSMISLLRGNLKLNTEPLPGVLATAGCV